MDLTPPTLARKRDVFSVSRLNRAIRDLIEGAFPLIWVEGEISNLSKPASGHWYFSLKDEAAQVRCAMFRNRNALVGFKPENGMNVLVRAQVSLYENRGDFQLIAEHIEEAGDGALRREFEVLKQRLLKAGLFAAEHKRPLPLVPNRIGVVTSPHGAAIRDVLSVLKRRFPTIPVLIYPTAVQGASAATEIASAIRTASQRNECDVLILTRGGGSLEDLWAFNEEVVARAVYDSTIPVVCGVGHETDFTIADFVADQRAATPSAAAELVSPNAADWRTRFDALQHRFTRTILTHVAQKHRYVNALRKRVQHPAQRLMRQSQRLDELDMRMQRAQSNVLRNARHTMNTVSARLAAQSPGTRIFENMRIVGELRRRLQTASMHKLQSIEQGVASLARSLEAVSPLATLARGYAVVRRDDGTVVRNIDQLHIGQNIDAQLAHGRISSTVTQIHES